MAATDAGPGARKIRALLLAAWVAILILPDVLAMPGWPWVGNSVLAIRRSAWNWMLSEGQLTALMLAVLISAFVFAALGRARWFVLVTIPFAALVPLESLYIFNYGAPSSSNVLAVVAETDYREASEFISIALLAALAAGVALIGLGAWLQWSLSRSDIVWRSRSRGLFLAVVGGTAASTFAIGAFNASPVSQRQTDPRLVFQEPLPEFARPLTQVYPWGVPLRVADFVARRNALARDVAGLRDFRFGASIVNHDGARNVVLVIGESQRADHFGVNGYERRTTPNLMRDAGAFSYVDAVSAAGGTRQSVPYLLTRQVPGVPATGAISERSVVSAFSEAGYKTWWISNQIRVGPVENEVSVYSEEADVRRWMSLADQSRQGRLDEVLVGELRKALEDPAPRHFVVVHTLGSHWDYRQRYPREFAVFRPAGEDGARWSPFRATELPEILNAYDNSILYTDHILGEMISVLSAAGGPSALLFMSDHGQALFQGRCLVAEHEILSATIFHVPLVVWVSPAYRAAFPVATKALAANTGKPVTVESVFPTLIDLAGVSLPGNKHSLSLANPDLELKPRYVTLDTRRWADFDRELPALDCALREHPIALPPSRASTSAQAPGDASVR